MPRAGVHGILARDCGADGARTPRLSAAREGAQMRIRIPILAAVAAVLLLAPAAPAPAVPPQFPHSWAPLTGGLRQIKDTLDTRAFCKGPSGTVYEVALGQTPAYYAAVARIRVSDGKVVRAWTYPGTPGAGVIPRAAASDGAGNLFVALETISGRRDWVVVKYSPVGTRLWRRSYDSGNGQDTPYGMAVDRRGDVIVVGTSEAAGGYDAAVVKWSAGGALRWKRVVSRPGLDLIEAVAVDADGNVYAAGDRGESGGAGTAILRSYTSGGKVRWTATAVSPAMPAWRHVVVRGKRVYVAGQSTGVPSTNALMAMKYTTAGVRAWSDIRTLTFANGAWAESLAVDRAGAPVVAGVVYGIGVSGEDQGVVWKLTPAGGTAWHSEFEDVDFQFDGSFKAVGVDSAGRIYAAGGKYYSDQTANLLMVRYSAGGSAQAMWRSDGQQSGYCEFTDLLVLSDSQVLAAGQVQGWVGGVNADACVYRAKTTGP